MSDIPTIHCTVILVWWPEYSDSCQLKKKIVKTAKETNFYYTKAEIWLIWW